MYLFVSIALSSYFVFDVIILEIQPFQFYFLLLSLSLFLPYSVYTQNMFAKEKLHNSSLARKIHFAHSVKHHSCGLFKFGQMFRHMLTMRVDFYEHATNYIIHSLCICVYSMLSALRMIVNER